MTRSDLAALRGRRVLVTGHTGFKGSWLTTLLHALGSNVFGYALPPEGADNLYAAADVRSGVEGEILADIRDLPRLRQAVAEVQPELVIHMAAQAFVRRSYAEPIETWDVNTLGTAKLLESVRGEPSVRGVLVVTTDKCYENRNWEWGYRETDRLGGHDPYSASKAGAELVVSSYRSSFYRQGQVSLVSARAGNVIGGGDWSEDRLVPDSARAARSGTDLLVRNPASTRPWQHVLDCLGGYLTVASRMIEAPDTLSDAYNFGPDAVDNLQVSAVLDRLQRHWPELGWRVDGDEGGTGPHEARHLYLDSSRARQQLGWRPRWAIDKALEKTATWYRGVAVDPASARPLMMAQIEEYLA